MPPQTKTVFRLFGSTILFAAQLVAPLALTVLFVLSAGANITTDPPAIGEFFTQYRKAIQVGSGGLLLAVLLRSFYATRHLWNSAK